MVTKERVSAGALVWFGIRRIYQASYRRVIYWIMPLTVISGCPQA
jgi:hypothetical protein